MTIFGPVTVTRMGYGGRGTTSLHPLDAALNLPPEQNSHAVQKCVVEEAAKTSFDETVAAVTQTTAARVPKRQAEELAIQTAAHFEAFYAAHGQGTAGEEQATWEILALSMDGKGIVMRQQDLREPTRKAAAQRGHKLATRLSKSEKRHAKRMAMVAAVYTIAPCVRAPEDIAAELGVTKEPLPRPRPEHKRVWASVEKPPEAVIAAAFQEADRRDPARQKRWVALVDGQPHQLRLLQACAARFNLALSIVLDLIHVLEYLWKAAFVFHTEGSQEVEAMGLGPAAADSTRAEQPHVAASIRRSATRRRLTRQQRAPADKCADYLMEYADFLRYDTYLAAGLPIATGVIEGVCRHLIKDRMDITGARWSLKGAEAVLRLRSLRSSGDFEACWRFHEAKELECPSCRPLCAWHPPHAAAGPPSRATTEATSSGLIGLSS